MRRERREIAAVAKEPRRHSTGGPPGCAPGIECGRTSVIRRRWQKKIAGIHVHDGSFPYIEWPAYSRRSSRFSTLPLAFRGRLSRQTTPLTRCCRPTRALVQSSRSAAGALCPGCSTTTASGVSPQRSLAIPITAASATAACSCITALDVDRIDVLSARENHVLFAIDDIEKTLCIDPTDITGTQPLGAGRVDPSRLAIGLVARVITSHHQSSAACDFSGFAGRDLAVVLAEDANVGAKTGLPTERTLRSRSSGSRMVISPSVSPYSSIKSHSNSRANPRFTSRSERRTAAHQGLEAVGANALRSGQREQPFELHGNEGAMGDAFSLDQRQRLLRIEGSQPDQRAANQHGREHRDPGNIGKQPERDERAAAAAIAQREPAS